MTDTPAPFLTAEWRHLAMLNYVIDPSVLRPLVPVGTELDDFDGRTYVSVVGFMFLNTRVLGLPIPFHRHFEEVNLRFYVRRKAADGWRRGVVFVKELVPRWAIAFVARTVYGENYVALPMSHDLGDEHAASRTVSYAWRLGRTGNRLEITVTGDPRETVAGSAEEFITEHYWGYARRRNGGTTEYQVEHPRWRVSAATASRLDGDVARLYGPAYVDVLKTPASAFLADGSAVIVRRGRRIA